MPVKSFNLVKAKNISEAIASMQLSKYYHKKYGARHLALVDKNEEIIVASSFSHFLDSNISYFNYSNRETENFVRKIIKLINIEDLSLENTELHIKGFTTFEEKQLKSTLRKAEDIADYRIYINRHDDDYELAKELSELSSLENEVEQLSHKLSNIELPRATQIAKEEIKLPALAL